MWCDLLSWGLVLWNLCVHCQTILTSVSFLSRVGWGIHPVSVINYHFIIPAETGPDSLGDSKSLVAITEACRSGKAHEDTIRLPTKVVSETAEHHASIYNADPSIYDSTKHRLHGVIHANGFGHLLRINGMYGGSQSATGLQILGLWDMLCDALGARDITVEDVSSKSGMELRIAYLLAYGQTWYGLLGYRFGRGPYNITEKRWQDAGTYIGSILLSQLIHDFEGVEERVLKIIRRYSLPVKGAAMVRDFGALLYRLLFLQLNPDQAKPFFDHDSIQKAQIHLNKSSKRRQSDIKRKKPKRKGLKFSVVAKKRPKTAVASNGSVKQVVSSESIDFGSFLMKLKTDPSAAASTVDDVKLKSELEVMIRGEMEPSVVIVMPSKRGRMHTIKLRNGKTRKVDLHVTPWRFQGSLAPLSGLDEETMKVLKEKEKSKLESIKNSKNNISNPLVLHYKANLSRDDFVERARQLCRALKALIPKAKGIFGSAKTRIEMEAAFLSVVGDDGPLPACKNSWWEYLPQLLVWAQDLLEIRGPQASDAIILSGNTIEIDKGFLYGIGMFPESWEIPLNKETLCRSNLKSQGDTTSKLRNDSGNNPEVEKPAIRTRLVTRASQRAASEVKHEEPAKSVETYIQESIDSTLESIWNSSVCPNDDQDGTNVPRSWHTLQPGATVEDSVDLVAVRNQISRDLNFLFMCTLKLYLPEIAKAAGQNAAAFLGEKYTPKLIKVRQISEESKVLRDTKHFVKTYHSIGVDIDVEKRKIAIWTRLEMPAELKSQHMSTTRFGRKLLSVTPPDELIILDENSTVKDYLIKVTNRFRSLYVMCSGFKATAAWMPDQQEKLKRAIPGAKMGRLMYLNNKTHLKSLITASSSVIRLSVAGEGYDLSPAWLHAGGPEDWVVNCPCGTRDDDGEAMVSCDGCEIWMHTRCVNVPDDTHGWLCNSCEKRQRMSRH